MNYRNLSKEISCALRHTPWEYELELDEYGWVSLDQLIAALRLNIEWQNLKSEDILKMIDSSEKKRHEVVENKIRALYGHSVPEKIVKQETQPPDLLFHGTARKSWKSIKMNGLLPCNRQYVHLSLDIKTAIKTGKRKDETPLILKINARKAWHNGFLFYHGGDNIWLTEIVDPIFIEKYSLLQ